VDFLRLWPDTVNDKESTEKRPRWNHGATFEAKVVNAATKGENTVIKQAQDFEVRPKPIKQ
jgi:hypothetical protein